MKKITCAILAAVIVLIFISPALAGTATSVNISPDIIEIGSNFNGSEMNISGSVPEGSDVYIKINSPYDSVLQLDKKGKVGLFWMNVENSVVKNVPKLYQIVSSGPFNKLKPDLMKEMGVSPDFSAAFTKAVTVRHSKENTTTLSVAEAGDYFKVVTNIYTKNHLYDVRENAVKISGGQYEANFYLPPNIPQEKCSVTVYTVKNGEIISSVTSPFRVTGIGMVKWLSQEAIYAGPEYGFLAVMIALGFGAGVAFMFSFLEGMINGKKAAGFSAGAGH